MALRSIGIAFLVGGLLVLGTGLFAAFTARSMWEENQAACAGSPDDWCGAGGTLAASFLFLLGPLGAMLGVLLLLAGTVVLLVRRFLDRTLGRGLDALGIPFR